MIRRPYRHQRSRSQMSPSQMPPGAAIVATMTIANNKARLAFSAPVVVSSLPLAITRQAAGAGPQLPPTAFSVVDPSTLDLTYAANVVATDILTIPGNVPEIVGNAGGRVAAAKHTF